jgi:hypothetical protein
MHQKYFKSLAEYNDECQLGAFHDFLGVTKKKTGAIWLPFLLSVSLNFIESYWRTTRAYCPRSVLMMYNPAANSRRSIS